MSPWTWTTHVMKPKINQWTNQPTGFFPAPQWGHPLHWTYYRRLRGLSPLSSFHWLLSGETSEASRSRHQQLLDAVKHKAIWNEDKPVPRSSGYTGTLTEEAALTGRPLPTFTSTSTPQGVHPVFSSIENFSS